MHIRKLSLESTEKFIRNAEQNNNPPHCFCLAINQEERGGCLNSQAKGYRTPKKRSGPLGTILFSLF